MAAIFGRRAVMVSAILTFALGSALSGAAQNMPMLIAARTIQGAGGGAILVCAEILVVDLVPIAERGLYFGILGSVWAIASTLPKPCLTCRTPAACAQLAMLPTDWDFLRFHLQVP